MYFYDWVKITITSGAGGNGCVCARKEAGVPFGGPAGGNGGRGGSIVFRATKDLTTLEEYKYVKSFVAPSGEPGRGKEQYGADAEDLILHVPVGTVIKNASTGHIMAELTEDGQTYCALPGGRGGVGNMHFKNAVRQYPTFALLGEPARTMDVILELQLLADVGLIGAPSVGKTTVINAVANTKAQVAEYYFTTLTPNLGVVRVSKFKNCKAFCINGKKLNPQVGDNKFCKSFTVIDIPGLIQGASQGKGLGNQFLRHVLKASVFALMVDISRYEQGFREVVALFDEILSYITQRFTGCTDFCMKITKLDIAFFTPPSTNHQKKGSKKGEVENFDTGEAKAFPLLVVYAYDEQGQKFVLFTKAIHFVINKVDLVVDEEVLIEYRRQFLQHIAAYIRKKFHTSCSSKSLLPHTFFVSAGAGWGLGEWVKYCSEVLSYVQEKAYLTSYPGIFDAIGKEGKKHGEDFLLFDSERKVFQAKKVGEHGFLEEQKQGKKTAKSTIRDVTEAELPFLLQHGYIDPLFAERIRVWEIYDEEICRLTFVLPWGNEQAQEWYWRVLEKKGWVKKLTQAGVLYGDVLKIVSIYEGNSAKYIEYKR